MFNTNRQREYCKSTIPERARNFKTRCREIHGFKYSYKDINYITDRTPIKLKCKVHGIFEIQPRHHLRGQICAKCKHEERGRNQRGTTEEFIKRGIAKYGDRFDYTDSEYIKLDESITIVCKEHGEFTTTPRKHLDNRKSQAGSCPDCRRSAGYNRSKVSIFYLFKIKETDIFKIGITNRTLEQRYNKTIIQEKIDSVQILDFPIGGMLRILRLL